MTGMPELVALFNGFGERSLGSRGPLRGHGSHIEGSSRALPGPD